MAIEIKPSNLFGPCPKCSQPIKAQPTAPPAGTPGFKYTAPAEVCSECNGLGVKLTPSGLAIRDLFNRLSGPFPIK